MSFSSLRNNKLTRKGAQWKEEAKKEREKVNLRCFHCKILRVNVTTLRSHTFQLFFSQPLIVGVDYCGRIFSWNCVLNKHIWGGDDEEKFL
jgi:hypothetical protein